MARTRFREAGIFKLCCAQQETSTFGASLPFKFNSHLCSEARLQAGTPRMRRLGVRAVRRSELTDRGDPVEELGGDAVAAEQPAPAGAGDAAADGDAWGGDAPGAATAGSKRPATPRVSDRPQRQRRPRFDADVASDTASGDGSYSDDGPPRASRGRREASSIARAARAAAAQGRAVSRPAPSGSLLRGAALADSLAAHPYLTLAAYNAAPTLPRKRLALAIIRVAGGVPGGAGAALPPAACSAPFAATRDAGPVAAVIGLSDVYEHLRFAMAALRADRAEPAAVSLPLAAAGDPPAPAPPLLDMVFVPDPTAAGGEGGGASGWAITRARWEQRLHGGARR